MRPKQITRGLVLTLLLAMQALAADVRWIGQASDVKQQDTITIANTWAADDTIVLAINNASITVTVGTDVATTDVAQIIVRAINASSDEENLLNDEQRTRGGQELPEFTDVEARINPSNASQVLVESRVAGVPFETTSGTSALSVTETTAGTGTATEALAVSATGREHFDNTANWSSGSLPTTGDRIFFESGPSCRYGLENTVDNLTVYVTSGYGSADIGLPRLNPAGYDEYRVRFLTIEPVATTGSVLFEIGVPGAGGAGAQGLRHFDTGSNSGIVNAAYVYSTGPRGQEGAPVKFVGGANFVCECVAGAVDISTQSDETAVELGAIRTNGDGADMRIGPTATFVNTGTNHVECNGGRMQLEADCTGSNNDIAVDGGTLTVPIASVSLQDVVVKSGLLDFAGAEINTVSIYEGGILDLTRASSALTISNDIELFDGFTFRDPRGLYQSDFDFNGCTPSDGNWEISPNIRLTLTPL